MPPFSIAEFADLVSSALALEDSRLQQHDPFQTRFGGISTFGNGNEHGSKFVGNSNPHQFDDPEPEPESPITRARRNAFDLSSSESRDFLLLSLSTTGTTSSSTPASASSTTPKEYLQEERSLARSFSLGLGLNVPSHSLHSSSYIPSARSSSTAPWSSIPSPSSSTPPKPNNNLNNYPSKNHTQNQNPNHHHLAKSNRSSGSSAFLRNSSSGPHRAKNIKFFEGGGKYKNKYKNASFSPTSTFSTPSSRYGSTAFTTTTTPTWTTAKASSMLLVPVPPPSDPAVVAATMSTVDLGAGCLTLSGGSSSASGTSGIASGTSSAKMRRASALGLGLSNREVESGWERNAMDPSSSGSGRGLGIKGKKLLPRISISGSLHSNSGAGGARTAPTSPVSPVHLNLNASEREQGQGPMKLFAKLKRQLSKNNVRSSGVGPPTTPSPTGLLVPFPSSPAKEDDDQEVTFEHALGGLGTKKKSLTLKLHRSTSVTFAASPSRTPTLDSDADWELVAPVSASASPASTSSLSDSSDDTVGSGKGKAKSRKRNKRRRERRKSERGRSGSPSALATKPQLHLQPQLQPQTLGLEDGDASSPSLYSCESAPRSHSFIGSSESFFLGRDEEDKLSRRSQPLSLQSLQADALSVSTSRSAGDGDYQPYLPLIIQHERLQQKLRMPVPFAAVDGGAVDPLAHARDPSTSRSRSRRDSGRGRQRTRTSSRGQASSASASTSSKSNSNSSSTSTSTTTRSKAKRASANAAPLPPPLFPPPACPPSPSPPPRRASAPSVHPYALPESQSGSYSHARSRASQVPSQSSSHSRPHHVQSKPQRGRATSPFSICSSSAASRASSQSRQSRQSEDSESRESLDSRGPVTPCTPSFFTASEGNGSGSVVAIAIVGSGAEGGGNGSGRGSGRGSMRSSVDSIGASLDAASYMARDGDDVDVDVLVSGLGLRQSEKEKYSTSANLPVSSPSSASEARRSLSASSKAKSLQRAASPTPRVCLTRSRSRQTLGANAGPASPPPSGPLPPPPQAGHERERRERARHSTPTPSITQIDRDRELYASRRGSSTQASSSSEWPWPLHHHPSSLGMGALFTPESRSFYASPAASVSAFPSPRGSAPPSPSSARGQAAVEDAYLSSSSTSSELQNLYRQGGQVTFDAEHSSISNSEYFSGSSEHDTSTEEDHEHERAQSQSHSYGYTEYSYKDPYDQTYLHRQQAQHHLLARLRGHLPTPSSASNASNSTYDEAAAALLAANTRANAGFREKIGVARQQVEGTRGRNTQLKEGGEWTLGLGPDAGGPASPKGVKNTHVCASGVTPDTTPVVPLAAAPAFVQNQKQQGMRKIGSGTNTSLPSSTSRPALYSSGSGSGGFLLSSADLSGSPGASYRERCKSESAARLGAGGGGAGAGGNGGSGRRGKEDWTLSLPGHVPQEWVKKIGGGGEADVDVEAQSVITTTDTDVDGEASSVMTTPNANVRHSAPNLGIGAGVPTDVLITVEDVDDPHPHPRPRSHVGSGAFEVDPTLRMSMVRSSITSDPRVGEIVLCVPRVVSSGSGIEDVVMDRSTTPSSSLHMGEGHQDRRAEEIEVQPEFGAEGDPMMEHKERVKANAKANLAKLDALSADLARFNEMLRHSGVSSSSSSFSSSPYSTSSSSSPSSMPQLSTKDQSLRHAKSCGVLEVDEPPPRNAVLRMPSVEVFLRDEREEDLRSVLDLGEEDDDNGEEDEEPRRPTSLPQVILSPVPAETSPALAGAGAGAGASATTRPAMARLSAASLNEVRSSRSMSSLVLSSPSSPSTLPSPTSPTTVPSPTSPITPSRRAQLPFAPFPPPTSFAPSKPRKVEGGNACVGVSGVLASGIFGSSVSAGGGARGLGRTGSAAPMSKPVLKLQTDTSAPATTSTSASARRNPNPNPSTTRRTSISSVSSSSTTSTATTIATAAFPSSMLVPSPMISPLETPSASAFPAPPPLSYPSLAAAVVGGRSASSKTAKEPEPARPSTTSSETSVSSVGTDETILPSVEQRMRMRLGFGLLGARTSGANGGLGAVESDHEDGESLCSGTYYSARSSFSSEAH